MTTTAQNRMKVISPKEVGDLLSGNLSEYEITALKFLQDTGTTLITKFSRFGKHFIGDTNDRNVFEVTLKNSKHEYTFDFGSSIKDSQKLVEICEWDELKDDDLVEVYAGISHTTKSISGSVKFKYKKSDIVNLNDAELMKQAECMAADYNAAVIKHNKLQSNKYNSVSETNGYKCVSHVKSAISRKLEELKIVKKEYKDVQSDELLHPTAYGILACLEKYPVNDFEDFCSNYGYDIDSRKAFKIYEAVKIESENVQKLFTKEELEILIEIQ